MNLADHIRLAPPFDQIAVCCHTEMAGMIANMTGNVADAQWVRDRVDAVHLFAAPDLNLGESFSVELAFNYQVVPSVEFEIIRLIQGRTVQLYSEQQNLSHFGYHIKDQNPKDKGRDGDTMAQELKRWQARGFKVTQVSQTVVHEGTKRRYRYAFVDTRSILGADTKIIQRMGEPSTERTIKEGRELFSWLS